MTTTKQIGSAAAEITPQFKAGDRIVYNDGREGHRDVYATVLEVTEHAMLVQFDDRADNTMIAFWDHAWMDFTKLCPAYKPVPDFRASIRALLDDESLDSEDFRDRLSELLEHGPY